jgi:hypothetical protein
MAELKPEPSPMNIATISAGFEKGDFLVREEQGNRVYFDFFEEVSPTQLSTTINCVMLSYSSHLMLSLFGRHSTTSPIKDTLACHEKMKNTGSI